MTKSTPSTQTRQAESPIEHRLNHLLRIGLLTLAVGLSIIIGGAPTLANAGMTMVARHTQPGQIQSVRPLDPCPSTITHC